jgi:hypothetical protein
VLSSGLRTDSHPFRLGFDPEQSYASRHDMDMQDTLTAALAAGGMAR